MRTSTAPRAFLSPLTFYHPPIKPGDDMRRKESEEKPPMSRNQHPNAHVLDTPEVGKFREGMRSYMPAWREATIQSAYLKFKRDKFMRSGAPIRHPVLVRDVLK